jgi:NitT/TauT family transport system substrate-binding protein
MKNVLHLKRFVAFSAFFAWLLLASGVVCAGEKTKLTVGALSITGHAKLFVAQEQGFFAEEDLEVELPLFTNSSDSIAAFRAGKLDVAAIGVAVILSHISHGQDAVFIAGAMGQDSMYITSAEKAPGIRSVDDLRGKKIGVVRMAIGDVVLRWALDQRGIQWGKDLQPFELKNPAAVIEAVKKGEVDVGAIWGPYDQGLAEKGLAVALRSEELLPGHPCCRIVLRTEDLNARPDVWVRFLRAILKAERYSKSADPRHRANTVDNIAKYVRLDKELVKNAFYGAALDQTTDPNADGIQIIWNVMNNTKIVNSGDDIQNFVEQGPYKSALESLIREDPDPFWAQAYATLNARNAVARGGGRSNTHWRH